MSGHAAPSQLGATPALPGLRDAAREATAAWWMWLASGIAWVLIALVILQFDAASVATVGLLVGVMFLFAAAQNFALAGIAGSARWVAAIFGAVFVIAGVICFIDPKGTFAALADILGFLFLMVGIWWMVRAFLERPLNPFWWLGLISGILMTALAFWTAGQFFVQRAYVLLVFAGIWALMAGINDIVRAFALKRVHAEL